MDTPTRKPNRLNGYDYSADGAYFITICAKDRKCLFSRIPVGADIIRPPEIVLTDYGRIVEQAIMNIPEHYSNAEVLAYVIMPNHVHILLRLTEYDGRMVSAPTIIGQMKRYVSKEAGFSIWQKGFYDHVIRGERDYQMIWEYIDTNPAKWREDELYIE